MSVVYKLSKCLGSTLFVSAPVEAILTSLRLHPEKWRADTYYLTYKDNTHIKIWSHSVYGLHVEYQDNTNWKPTWIERSALYEAAKEIITARRQYQHKKLIAQLEQALEE